MIPPKASRFKGVLAAVPALVALLIATPAVAEQVIFTEIHYNPPAGKPEFIEIYNNTATPFDTGRWYFSDGVQFTFPDFDPAATSAHILRPFERILVSNVDAAALRAAYAIPAATRIFGPYTGALNNAGETLVLRDKNHVLMAELTYNDGGKWPAAPDGTGHTLTRINPNLAGGEWRNWASSATPGGTPGSGPLSEDGQLTQIATTTSTWKYDQSGNDLGTAWREPGYDDSAWLEGPGVFGKDGVDRGFQTPWLTGTAVTYYLRKEFQWDNNFSSATIDIEALLDDGVVIYLNGQEIGRRNLPAGAINYLTTASSAEANALVDIATNADISAALQVGTNLLAAEVHNQSLTSSDIVFGGNFTITSTPEDLSNLLVISEVHFGGDGHADWVELHAPGQSTVGVSSMSLASVTDLSDATRLTGSVPGGGYRSFAVDFPVAPNGNLNLYLALGNSVLDAHKFDRDRGEESFQSLPVGKEFYGGPGHTRDAPNNPGARITDIVINEIMFDPPSDQTNGEFIELYNRGASSVDLSNWRFTDGVSFDFPPGTSLAAGAYLVVAADAACLTAAHGAIPVIGNWGGSLRDGGELIRLEDSNGNLADEVDYLPAGDWPELADGDGSSMELRHPDMDNDAPTAWADSDETGKAAMQEFSFTETFQQVVWQSLNNQAQELHAHLVGDSHVIIENVSLKLNNAGANLVRNPTVMSPNASSASGWVAEGTHWATFMDNGQLHLIADGHGDNKANRAEVDISALSAGNSYTLTFQGRWVSGKPRVILQSQDHGFGTSFLFPVPENLGTPGAANSRLLTSPAPTVTAVIHSPAVPAPTTPVRVSARVRSSAALTSVQVVHRLDSASGNTAWQRTDMADDGTGLYSATLTQYNQDGNIVQFYVEAKSGSATTFQPKLGADRPAMWIADNRTMPDSLLRERFIMSAYDKAALTSTGGTASYNFKFPRMSNHFFNATFIANESEIFYNAEIRKSGSPFTRANDSNLAHGKWKLPGDRLFRGRHRSVFDPSGNENTPRYYDDRVARYFLYQLGHPTNEMEFVHWVVNSDPFKLRENHEPISNDFLNRNYADGTDGTLLRIDDEWYFPNDGTDAGRNSQSASWRYKNSDNPVRYHSEWLMRSREADYDYSNFIEFVRTIGENNFDEAKISRLANIDMLCLNAAVRGYDGDWDTLTSNRGKNAYFYRPKDEGAFGGGWMLLHWDGDRVFESGHLNDNIIGGLTGIGTFFNKPFVKRRLNYYLTKLMDEHANQSSPRTLAWMQAETAAVAGTGITMTQSHYTDWFRDRNPIVFGKIGAAITGANFTISTSNAPTANDRINLAGTAPPGIYAVRVAGQGSPTFSWTNETTWTLSGVQLMAGANSLAVEGIDHEGQLVQQLTFNITKTTDAPPVVAIGTTPRSKNVFLGETLRLDASSSYDPEGGALLFAWQVAPTDGVNLVPSGPVAIATFTRPGLYTFTATATDPQSHDTARSVDVAAFGPASFSAFGNAALEGFWGLLNTEKHGNAPGSPHYSLQDNPGRLTIHIPLSLTPLGLPQPELPAPVRYVDFGDTWRYDDSNAELTGTFAQPGFDDSAWLSGPGFLGFNQAGVPAPGLQTDTLRRDNTAGLITYYFRTTFEFNADPVGAQIVFDQIVDDGVRYYLNGQVLGNVRLPEGVINSNTPATTNLPVENVIEEDVLSVDGSSSLVVGTNVLAAEVHNSSAASSDLVFGTRMEIAANPLGNGGVSLDDVLHPWVYRPVPATGDWTLQTEVKLEKAQFGAFFAGLLVEADQGGNAFRYGVGFENGNAVAALRVNPSGTSESLQSVPAIATDLVTVRLQRSGDLLIFSWDTGDRFTVIHQISLPAGTTFSRGGAFASTETEQSLEASFDYVMLVDSTPASTVPLIVSEIMYNPAGTSALEFLELYNAGPAPIDLAGFATVAGEPFDAFTFPAYTLQPGAYGLLVANQDSFSAAYPATPPGAIIGQWPGGNLSNSGELITITDSTGALVTSFSYDDNAPWPTSPDGDGPSLVINDEDAGLDPNLGSNWHASALIGGSPGTADSAGPSFNDWMAANGFADPYAEFASSGLSNLLAYALGRDLATDVAPRIGDSGGFAAFSHRQRLGDSSLIYSIETSGDLALWSAASDLVQMGAPVQNGDGTQTLNLLSNLPTSARGETFYRLRVTLP